MAEATQSILLSCSATTVTLIPQSASAVLMFLGMARTRNDLGERDHQADSVDCCDESDALPQIDIFIIPRGSFLSICANSNDDDDDDKPTGQGRTVSFVVVLYARHFRHFRHL